jgi:putative membrane protein
MKTTHTIASSVAFMLAAACGNSEPAKTAYEAPPAQGFAAQGSVHPSPDAMTESPAPMNSVAGPTSADLSREGPRAGNAEAQPAIPLTDGQILQITHTANLGEINQARLALSRSKDARVRTLAQMMVQDHSQADKKGMVLAKKENLEREPSATSESLESDAESTTGTLKAEPAADFDKNYVDAQIRQHQAVLDTIDQKLVVNAANPELKAYLTEIRAAVASHLRHAQDVQNELQK